MIILVTFSELKLNRHYNTLTYSQINCVIFTFLRSLKFNPLFVCLFLYPDRAQTGVKKDGSRGDIDGSRPDSGRKQGEDEPADCYLSELYAQLTKVLDGIKKKAATEVQSESKHYYSLTYD